MRSLTLSVSQVRPHQSPVACPPVQGVEPGLPPREQGLQGPGVPHPPPESGPDCLTEVWWLGGGTRTQRSQQITVRFAEPVLQVGTLRVGERLDGDGLVRPLVDTH